MVEALANHTFTIAFTDKYTHTERTAKYYAEGLAYELLGLLADGSLTQAEVIVLDYIKGQVGYDLVYKESELKRFVEAVVNYQREML